MDVQRRIDAPAEAVWALLSRTSAWPDWGPSVRAVEPADVEVRPGLRGRVTTVVGIALPFEITEVEAGRRPPRRA